MIAEGFLFPEANRNKVIKSEAFKNIKLRDYVTEYIYLNYDWTELFEVPKRGDEVLKNRCFHAIIIILESIATT